MLILIKSGGGLAYIGKHSMAIMIGHFLCFKLVSYGLIAVWKIPYFCASAFPVLTDTGIWWIIYTLVGVGIPLVAQYIWKKFKYSVLKIVGR